VPIVCRSATSLPGAATLVPVIPDSQRVSHMCGHCSHSAASIPGQEILVDQLLYGKLLPLGILRLAGSRALHVALNILCIAIVVELLL
jgi:hypothetical protein